MEANTLNKMECVISDIKDRSDELILMNKLLWMENAMLRSLVVGLSGEVAVLKKIKR